jgi:hypothetical protein
MKLDYQRDCHGAEVTLSMANVRLAMTGSRFFKGLIAEM